MTCEYIWYSSEKQHFSFFTDLYKDYELHINSSGIFCGKKMVFDLFTLTVNYLKKVAGAAASSDWENSSGSSKSIDTHSFGVETTQDPICWQII